MVYMKPASSPEENDARIICSRILENLRYMELIGDNPDGSTTFSDGKGYKAKVYLWTKKERKFLCNIRNQFAHSIVQINPDGTVHTTDHKRAKKKIYSLEQLRQLFAKINSLTHDRLAPKIEVIVECLTCGEQAYGDAVLSCAHVDYGELDLTTPALVRKPNGANVTSIVKWDGVSDAKVINA